VAAVKDMIRYYRNHPSVIVWETSLNEASYTDSWAQTINTAAHAEYPGNQMYTTGWQTSVFDVFCAASQGGVRSTTDSRPVICCEYGDWDIGCSWTGNTPITNCQDRVLRSDGESALLRQVNNHYNELGKNRALTWLSGDALWSAFDYQSWNWAPLTSSGAIDIFRLPKYSAWFYKSQRSPADTLQPGSAKGGPMVFIASSWTSSSAIPVTVFSNCEQVTLYLNDAKIATQSPVAGTNLEHPKFSFTIPSFQSGTLRADGLIGGVVKTTHSVTTPGTAAKVSVAIDMADQQLIADGSDIAVVYASILDANGAVIPTASTSVTFSVTGGPGDLVGNATFAAQAGIATVLLRSRTTAGAISISAGASGLSAGSATITSIKEPATGMIGAMGRGMSEIAKSFILRRTDKSLLIEAPRFSSTGGQAAFSLCNARGERVGQWELKSSSLTLPLASLPHGIYLCQFSHGEDRLVKKILW
jgi:beta-galactosidase